MNRIEYNDFELNSLEIKAEGTEYKAEWTEHFEDETSEYKEANKRGQKSWRNVNLRPICNRLTSFISSDEAIELVKITVFEFAREIQAIKIVYQSVKDTIVTKTTVNKSSIVIAFGEDRLEEAMTCLEEIKMNLYQVLIGREVFEKKSLKVSVSENGELIS